MDIISKLPQFFLLLTQPENITGLLVWLVLLMAVAVVVYKLLSRVPKKPSHKIKQKPNARPQSLACAFAWICITSLVILFVISMVGTLTEVGQTFDLVEENFAEGDISSITCAPNFACDVLTVENGQIQHLRIVHIKDDFDHLGSGFSPNSMFGSILIVNEGEVGIYRQSEATPTPLIIYISADQILYRLQTNFLLPAAYLSLLFLFLYFGLIRSINKSLVATKMALADGNPAILAQQPKPFLEMADLQQAIFKFHPQAALRLGQVGAAGLNLVSYTFAELYDLRSELFEPLTGLGAASLRILPITEDAESKPLCSRENDDPFSKVDPIILTLAAKTNELFLESTSKLFKNSTAAGQFLPRALFFIRLEHGGNLLGVIWGAFQEEHIFSSDEVETVKAFAAQLCQTPQNQAAQTIGSDVENQKLTAILRSTPDPLLLLDADNNVQFANKNASSLFGVAFEKEIGSPVDKLGLAPALVHLLRATSTNETATEIILKNDKTYSALSKKVSIMNLRNARLWIFRDITNFKDQERLKTEFVNTVSHDLRGPLSLIRGYANMIEMVGSLNEQQSVYAQKINDSIEDMSKLINSLLDLGRIDAGVSMQLEILSVKDYLEKICAPIQVLAIQKKINFNKEFIGQDVLIQVDPGLIQQAVTNLLENAIKYSSEGSQVSLKVSTEGGKLNLSVHDTGFGIAKSDQPHLFEKFYRGKTAEIKTRKGSGLGLAIVKAIVEHHHGQVWFDSQEGMGSNFYISLPVRQ